MGLSLPLARIGLGTSDVSVRLMLHMNDSDFCDAFFLPINRKLYLRMTRLFRYFPTNYPWNLSVMLSIEMGARMKPMSDDRFDLQDFLP